MACSHIYARECAQFSDGEGQFGSRAKRRKQINFYSVRCQDLCGKLRELFGIIAAVIGENDPFCRILARFFDVISYALSRTTHGFLIHTVCSRTADSAKSGSTKDNFLIESVSDFGFISGNSGEFLFHRIAVRQFFHPKVISFYGVHVSPSFSCKPATTYTTINGRDSQSFK